MAYKRKSPMPIIEGGTNASSMATTDGVVYYDGTKLVTTSAGVAGEVLTSNGPGVAPTYQVVGGGVLIKVTVYTSNDTWTKDADAAKIAVIGWNGGAGGGSGRQGVSPAAGGGGGGAGGGGFYFVAPANCFGATETVTIGAGGAGGAAQAGANSNGNPGSAGGQTKFGGCGTSVGTAGAGGTNGTASGGSITNGFLFNNDSASSVGTSYTIAAGGSGTTTTGSTPADFGTTAGVTFAGLSGGGGSGADSMTERQAGTGAGHVYWGNTGTLLAGGAGGIESGTINGSNGNDGLTILGVPTVGGGRICGGTGGGGGGGQSVGAAAGNGGNGGFPGGGGGGGGGSINGTNSGAGGDGGDGMVIVIEYL